MPIDDKVVRDVAALSRVRFDPAEAPRFVKELQDILAYVEQLQTLDVSGIEPTSQVGAGVPTPLREDRVVPSDAREEALEQAPDRDGDYFRVPRVV
jgi:aspartyl-tRNA(Asn)/glutamyl-tRNA(Gln) amidotransferase subunit C